MTEETNQGKTLQLHKIICETASFVVMVMAFADYDHECNDDGYDYDHECNDYDDGYDYDHGDGDGDGDGDSGNDGDGDSDTDSAGRDDGDGDGDELMHFIPVDESNGVLQPS